MRAIQATLATVVLCIGCAAPAFAHHSGAMYDFNRTQWLEGVVKKIRVINPHTTLTLAVTDATGTHDIDFEGHSVNNFYRVGWRPDMIKVGDRIKIKFSPRKDGREGGFVSGFITAKGRRIVFTLPGQKTKPPAASAGR